MEEPVRHYLISGRVQGVGYRAFAAAHARELNVRGWTRNLRDGRVEIVACASVDVLGRFEASLKRGPSRGEVTDLGREEWPPRPGLFAIFDVRKDATLPCSASSPS